MRLNEKLLGFCSLEERYSFFMENSYVKYKNNLKERSAHLIEYRYKHPFDDLYFGSCRGDYAESYKNSVITCWSKIGDL
jgi:hypothetical protein